MNPAENLAENGASLGASITTSNPGVSAPVHIWLVDDNDQLRNLLAELLGQVGGIVCARQFASPDAMLSTLASRIGPDVILLDVNLGAQNGIEAIPAIKSLSRSTRVLMLTTFFDEAARRQALEFGASGFLLKSDSLAQIADRIRNRQADEPTARFAGRARRQRMVSARCPEPAAAVGEEKHTAAPAKTPLLRWLKRFANN